MMNPFDLPGMQFLALYGVFLVVAIVVGALIPRWLRPAGQPNFSSGDPDRLAFLAGGAGRVGESVVARLLAREAVGIEGRDRIAVRAPELGRTAGERAVLALPSPATWSQVSGAVQGEADALEGKLVSQGLLLDRGAAMRLRLAQTAPYLLLLAFGAIKWQIGVARDRPVGFLTFLLIATAIFALFRFLALDRRTRAGLAALADARLQSDRLRRAPTTEETGLAVALFGTSVLAGSMFADFHMLRSATSTDSGSSSSCTSDSSSSSCGSSGCGGCGGGGD